MGEMSFVCRNAEPCEYCQFLYTDKCGLSRTRYGIQIPANDSPATYSCHLISRESYSTVRHAYIHTLVFREYFVEVLQECNDLFGRLGSAMYVFMVSNV